MTDRKNRRTLLLALALFVLGLATSPAITSPISGHQITAGLATSPAVHAS